MPADPMPPLLLIQIAVAAVWLYEGVWCKVLGRSAHELEVVEATPLFSKRQAWWFLKLLGVYESLLALWVMAGWLPVWCALVQTLTLIGLNSGGLLFSRHLIPDPAGMVVKNAAFLVLAWVVAGFLAA
jgi:hypothetical protein